MRCKGTGRSECTFSRPARRANGPGRGRGRAAVHRHRAEAKPGPPHVVRLRTDIFLRRGKCPRRRVRCGGTGRSECTVSCPARRANGPGRGILFRPGAGEAVSLSAAARCDPDTLPWRPKCSSQAHYAAAAPRLARISSGGMPGKTGGPRPGRGCCSVPPHSERRQGRAGVWARPPLRCGTPGMFHVEHSGGGKRRNVPHGTFFKAQRKKEGQNASAQRPRRHNI